MTLATSYPSQHPFISQREKDYLLKAIGRLERDQSLQMTPWRAIVTSTPVIALIATKVTNYPLLTLKQTNLH